MAFLESKFDADALFDGWAAELYIQNDDGYIFRANNFFVYHEPSLDRWWMLPWGLDQVWETDLDVSDPVATMDPASEHGVLSLRCLEIPACVGRLNEHLLAIADLAQSAHPHAEAVRLIQQLAGVSRRDPMSPNSGAEVMWSQNAIADRVRGRPGQVRRQVP